MAKVSDPIMIGCFSVKEVPVATAFDIPDAIVAEIMHLLNSSDAENLATTCKQFRVVFENAMPLILCLAQTGIWNDLTEAAKTFSTENGINLPCELFQHQPESVQVLYTDGAGQLHREIFPSTEVISIVCAGFQLLSVKQGAFSNVTRALRDRVTCGRRLRITREQRQSLCPQDQKLEIVYTYRGHHVLQLQSFPVDVGIRLQAPLLILRALLRCHGEEMSIDVSENVKQIMHPRIANGPLCLDLSREMLCEQLHIADPDPVMLKQLAIIYIPANADRTQTRVLCDGEYAHIPPFLHILSATYRSCKNYDGRVECDITETVQQMAAIQGHALHLPAVSKREIPELSTVIGDARDEEMELVLVYLLDDGSSDCQQKLLVVADCEPVRLP